MELSKQGLRERIVQTERAPGVPFDHGRFELILEKSDASTVGVTQLAGNALVQITPAKRSNGKTARSREELAKSKKLTLCRGCNRHVFLGTKICPFCDGDIDALAKLHKARLHEARRAYVRLAKLLPSSISANSLNTPHAFARETCLRGNDLEVGTNWRLSVTVKLVTSPRGLALLGEPHPVRGCLPHRKGTIFFVLSKAYFAGPSTPGDPTAKLIVRDHSPPALAAPWYWPALQAR